MKRYQVSARLNKLKAALNKTNQRHRGHPCCVYTQPLSFFFVHLFFLEKAITRKLVYRVARDKPAFAAFSPTMRSVAILLRID